MLKPTCVLLLGLFALARAEMEGFIVGGQHAKIINHAHSVYLDIYCVSSIDNSKSGWMCGASVLNQKILLTAGHCLYTCNAESHINIHIGNENWEDGQVYTLYSFLIHEDYNPRTDANDICLVKVQKPLKLSGKASRVALMKRPPYREMATVAGWGVTDEISGKSSNQLNFVNQKVMTRQTCLGFFKYLELGTICAADENNKGYPSRGDSGSALVVRGYIQIGIVAYRTPSVSKSIIVFTDVGYFYDWIINQAKKLNCYN